LETFAKIQKLLKPPSPQFWGSPDSKSPRIGGFRGLSAAEIYYSDLAPDVENRILSKITTNSIGFQLLKIRFFGFFGLGARSQYY